jgi:radical SAM protein with 4Fe4S-binding SPASM domain
MAAEFLGIRLLNPTREPSFAPWPTAIGMDITNRCQLDCRHCFNRSGPGRRDELPLAVIERTLGEMRRWGVGLVRLTGGEPTLHSRFEAILDACAVGGIAVHVNTHGVVSETTLERLLSDPVKRCLVSLDGLEEVHDQVRGTGCFRHAITTCRRLCATGKAVTITCHYGRHNIGNLAGLGALAAGMGADLKFSALRPMGRLLDQFAFALPTPEDGLRAAREVVRLRRRYPDLRIASDFDILDDRREPSAITDAWSACGAGRVLVSVAANGDVYPCAYFATGDHRFRAGNLNVRSLGEIWRNSPVFTPFRTHSKSSDCQTCTHYRRRCAGGCPAVAYHLLGAFDALDPNCFSHLVGPET